MPADRELSAQVNVRVPPQVLWQVLADVSNLVAASPELLAMVPLKPGGLRSGQWYVGLNRRGLALWATRNVVVELEAGRRLVWDTRTSGARWSYELTGREEGDTTLTLTRTIPGRLTFVGRLYARLFLGGGATHADQLADDIQVTLAEIRQVAEASARR